MISRWHNQKTLRLLVPITAVLLILLVLLSSCTQPQVEQPTRTPIPPEPTREPTPPDSPFDAPIAGVDLEGPLQYEEIDPSKVPFIPDQLMLTGLPADLDSIAEAVADELGIELRLLAVSPLSGRLGDNVGQTIDKPQRLASARRQVPAGLETRLYRLEGGDGLPDLVLEAINIALRLALEQGLPVFADANYLTASPWGIGGAPWGIGGASAGGSTAAANLWRTQWALGDGAGGVELVNTAGEAAGEWPDSQAVKIYVLDTSPFAAANQGVVSVAQAPELSLFVSYPATAVSYTVPGADPAIREHGLFVSGLAHVVAPGSGIHLVRTLSDEGWGDLFTLVSILDGVIAAETADDDDMSDVVLNLSLRVNVGLDEALPEETLAHLAELYDQVDPAFQALLDPDNPLPALQARLVTAHDLGAVVVAAAGNDSDRLLTPATIEAIKVPAAWPQTLGVAGTNYDGDPSCFSNDPEPGAELSAPAGDGKLDAAAGPGCQSPAADCDNSVAATGCQYGLVSLVTNKESGFATWAGTSFAAPLVSGTAALVRAQCPSASPDQIKAHILANATAAPVPRLNAAAVLAAGCP